MNRGETMLLGRRAAANSKTTHHDEMTSQQVADLGQSTLVDWDAVAAAMVYRKHAVLLRTMALQTRLRRQMAARATSRAQLAATRYTALGTGCGSPADLPTRDNAPSRTQAANNLRPSNLQPFRPYSQNPLHPKPLKQGIHSPSPSTERPAVSAEWVRLPWLTWATKGPAGK